jgi:hypothetical protein
VKVGARSSSAADDVVARRAGSVAAIAKVRAPVIADDLFTRASPIR